MRLRVSQAVDVRLGRQRSPAHEQGGHPICYLRSANITDGALDLTDVKSMNFTPAEQAVFRLREGDILVTEGSGSREAVGASAVWRGNLPGTTCFQNTLLRLRPRAGVTDGRFVAWWARHAHGSGQFAAGATGANILHLGSDGIKRIQLDVPPLDEQRQVADFLDDQVARIDAVIAARHRQVEGLGAEYVSFVTQQIDGASSAGTVPLRRLAVGIEQGWSPTAQTSPAENGEPGVVKLGSVRAGDFRASENKAFNSDVTPDERYLLRQDDLLVTRANTLSLVGDVAVAEVTGSDRLYLSDLIYRVTLKDADPRFVSLALRAPKVRQLLGTLARGTSQSMAKLRGEDLLALPIPDVPAAEQQALGARDRLARESLGQRRAQLERSASLLAEYKQSLITAAVSGELDVTTAGKGPIS